MKKENIPSKESHCLYHIPWFINMKLHLECPIIEQRNKGLIAADVFYLYSNSSDFETSENVKNYYYMTVTLIKRF